MLVDGAAPPEEKELALVVINNWRWSHAFPLHTFQMNLRRQASQRDRPSTVAQRLKRLPSIRHKLDRMPAMKLSRMQDIGGCRAVVSTVPVLNALVEHYKASSHLTHELIREDEYLAEPRASGYRGIHLVYRYHSVRQRTWNGLSIEIQLRSRLQHAWATALETVRLFMRARPRDAHCNEEDWRRFFALMSSAIARWEGTPAIPGTPTKPGELVRELRDYVVKLDVVARLSAYGAAVSAISGPEGGHTFLLELDIARRELSVRSYADRTIAAQEYSAVERAIESEPSKDVVLVTVESLAALRCAYPNYFLDTQFFARSVEEAVR